MFINTKMEWKNAYSCNSEQSDRLGCRRIEERNLPQSMKTTGELSAASQYSCPLLIHDIMNQSWNGVLM